MMCQRICNADARRRMPVGIRKRYSRIDRPLPEFFLEIDEVARISETLDPSHGFSQYICTRKAVTERTAARPPDAP